MLPLVQRNQYSLGYPYQGGRDRFLKFIPQGLLSIHIRDRFIIMIYPSCETDYEERGEQIKKKKKNTSLLRPLRCQANILNSLHLHMPCLVNSHCIPNLSSHKNIQLVSYILHISWMTISLYMHLHSLSSAIIQELQLASPLFPSRP